METKSATKLEDRFLRWMETVDDAEGVLADDVVLDVTVPGWRYQVQGRAAAAAGLQHDCPGGQTIERVKTIPTSDGFLSELETRYTGSAGGGVFSRYVNIATVRDGLISELTIYCAGEWDAETEARIAAEAPTVQR